MVRKIHRHEELNNGVPAGHERVTEDSEIQQGFRASEYTWLIGSQFS
jgi:hypothetical protein